MDGMGSHGPLQIIVGAIVAIVGYLLGRRALDVLGLEHANKSNGPGAPWKGCVVRLLGLRKVPEC